MTSVDIDPFERAIYKSVKNRGCATVRDVRNDINYSLDSFKIAGILRILSRYRLIRDTGDKDRYGSTIWTISNNHYETIFNF